MPPLTCLLKPQSPFEDSAGEVFAVALASFGAFFAFAAVSLEVEVVGRAVHADDARVDQGEQWRREPDAERGEAEGGESAKGRDLWWLRRRLR